MIVLVAIGIAVAGCGSEGKPDVRFDGNIISIFSVGTTADIDCADGKLLNVDGSKNTLTAV